MREIIVIDDQYHALMQIVYEFPQMNRDDIVFRHISSISAFRKENIENAFLIFLDFFLSIDREYGSTLIPELKCDNLVCFSSKKEMSDHMLKIAIEAGKDRIKNVYSVQKIKDELKNAELREVLNKILTKG